MLRNYFKIAIRSFIQQKYFSLINTLGLALGTAACILILFFVNEEISYERGFEKNKQITFLQGLLLLYLPKSKTHG